MGKNNPNRRTVLKTLGSATIAAPFGSGIVSASNGTPSKDPVLQKSLNLMENKREAELKKLRNMRDNGNLKENSLLNEIGISPESPVGSYLKANTRVLVDRVATDRSVNKRIKFLNNHDRGASADSTHHIVAYPKESDSDGPTTQVIGENQVSCWMADGYSSFDNADEWVDCNYSISGGGGDNPEDVVTMAWPSSDFELVEGGEYKHNMSNGYLRSSSFGSSVWNYADGAACGIYCDLNFTVGCHLDRLASPGKVDTTYQHAWGGCGNLSVTVGFGSISVTPTCGSAYAKQLLRKVTEF